MQAGLSNCIGTDSHLKITQSASGVDAGSCLILAIPSFSMKFLSNPKRLFGAALLTLPAGLTSGQDLKLSEPLTANVERLLTTVVINSRGLALL